MTHIIYIALILLCHLIHQSTPFITVSLQSPKIFTSINPPCSLPQSHHPTPRNPNGKPSILHCQPPPPSPTTTTPKLDLLRRKLLLKRRTSWSYFIGGLATAVASYGYNVANPVSELKVLEEMTRDSVGVNVVGVNNKPTVLEFWAPWCENCKSTAFSTRRLRSIYSSRVNFILIDGDDKDNSWLVDRFRVDAIPHVAFIDREGFVETSLIGVVPEEVVRRDLEALVNKEELPYVMYDPWKGTGGTNTDGRNVKGMRDPDNTKTPTK
mmetsp:Transcript_17298/g.35644  ORF Transcript_17298/g.35644 Transcript_17298/m.35644 type:complete len:267 (+) Transcript_17298:49-849(+)